MIRNYLKIALRTLRRNRLYTTLNVVGITFGFSCFLLIGLYVLDELTYDSHHARADQLYRVIRHKKTPDENVRLAGAGYKVAEESKKSIGEIENTARMTLSGRDNLENVAAQKKVYEDITAANNGLMELFDFESIEGNPRTALVAPFSIIIVEDLAMKLFGDTKVVGKTLKWQGYDQPFTITAVIKNHPKNSSFTFNSVYSESTYLTDSSYVSEMSSDWGSGNFVVYALLKKGADPQATAQKLKQLVYANFKPDQGVSLDYSLQPIRDMHLHSETIVDRARNASQRGIATMSYVRVFMLIALFVLFIACINYMNLTTAKASNRSKEIGVKKVVGAFRSQLITQFLTESLLVTLLSFVVSIGCVNLMLPFFNNFTGKQLSLGISTDYRIWLTSLSMAVLTGLLSGSYPALMLSRLSPILLLKSLKIQSRSNFSLRKGLVVFQFAVSVILIVATITMFLQVKFVNNKDLGFNKERLVVVDINSGDIRRSAQTIKTEFAKLPNVRSVSTTSRVPGEWKTIPTVKIKQPGSTDEPKVAHLLAVDERFTQTFGVKLLNGKNFSGSGDSSSVLLNETAARLLNITEPSEQMVDIPSVSFGSSYSPLRSGGVFRARVIGIVKDFHVKTLREKIGPVVLAYQNNPVHPIDYYTARIDVGDASETLKKMEGILAKIDPTHLFEYHYLDQQLALFYVDDTRRGTMLIWASLAAILIACLGLFGLATYAAEQRMKEVGVRKVLGASVANITILLSKDFLKLVLIAIVIASPLAWYAMNRWLADFAYKIDMEWWVFALAGLLAVGIALLTVSFQAIKAALMNPVKSLRSE